MQISPQSSGHLWRGLATSKGQGTVHYQWWPESLWGQEEGQGTVHYQWWPESLWGQEEGQGTVHYQWWPESLWGQEKVQCGSHCYER